MKYTVSRCPTCGGLLVAELNTVPVLAGLIENDEGGFDYSGNSRVDWNAQEPWLDENGLTIVHCAEHHPWETRVEPESPA